MANRKQIVLAGIREYWFMYAAGSVCYSCIEMLYRGYTHFTMVILGGICGAALYRIYTGERPRSLLGRAILAALTVTVLEFFVGCVVNLGLGLGVWDYRNEPHNLLGQISPAFSLAWFLLSFPAFGICHLAQYYLFPCLDARRT